MQVDVKGILDVSAKCSADGVEPVQCQINTHEIFNQEEIAEAIKIQQELMDLKENKRIYLNLCNDLQSCISKLKAQNKSEAGPWEDQYKVFIETIPKKSDLFDQAISRLRQTIDAIKMKIT